ADERGRSVFTISFAEAAERAWREQLPKTEEPPSTRVTYLDIERAKRELLSVEHEVRERIHDTSRLVGHTRNQADDMRNLLRSTADIRERSRELLERSRSQTPVADWSWGRLAGLRKVPG